MAWVEDQSEFHFYRYRELREMEETPRSFPAARPGFDLFDRYMGEIDTCIRP
ncbi:hypothetical protein OJ996_25950 [Luteolibacter sp. GHJ8]|uniref:Uncharacterized protein n=1 Tax=Luteolibacter rhizosphaerae TaxID=2989719 RepID=A0ABT3GCW2_9BACT|nr:hypothetical protein [Luteolibacter rhizosphaerae]MCW1917060.1 hypothetical protein [Luteolibacter rhizosphaerae]